MWSTFLNTMRVNLREKSSVFWLFCFPIILSTMFMGMFGNISGEVMNTYDEVRSGRGRELLQGDQRASDAACDAAESTAERGLRERHGRRCARYGVRQVGSELRNLLGLQAVSNVKEAKGLINADHGVRGYINATEDGLLNLTISRASVASVNDDTGNSGFSASLRHSAWCRRHVQ